MKFPCVLLVGAAVLFGGVGCNKIKRALGSDEVAMDIRGSWVEERVYENEVFDFKITFPKGWVIEKKDEELPSEVADVLAADGDGAGLKEMIDGAFQVFLAKPDQEGAGGNLVLMLENVSAAPQVRDAKSYMTVAKTSLKQMFGPKMQFVGGAVVEKIGEREFVVQRSTMTIGEVILDQKSCVLYADDHVMVLTITKLPGGGEDALQAALDSISAVK